MRKVNIDKETIEKALEEYKFKNVVCEKLGICVDTLNVLIKEHGIHFVKHHKTYERKLDHPEIDKQWMIENWVNTTKSMRQLADEVGVAESLIDSRREMFKLVKHYKHKLNDKKLFDLTDPRLYYLAGLIATDGYIPAKQNAVEISLVGADEERLLQEINDYYENTNKLVHYGRDDIAFIRLVWPGLNSFLLENFSLPDGAKTFTVDVPKAFYNEDCAKAYIRGCLDGDGSISSTGHAFGLTTASEKLVLGIKHILETYIPEKFCYYLERNKYPTICASDRKCRLVLDWVYSLDDCFKLERKYKRYLNYNKS